MLEFHFFGTWEDFLAVLEAITSSGTFTLVPSMWYDGPEPLRFRTLDPAFLALLKQRRRLFLWSEAFSPSFPVLRRQGSGAMAGRYHVDVGPGVPLLDLFVPPCYEADGLINLGAGDLTASRTIVDRVTLQEEPATEVVAAFKLVRSRMKQVLTRHKMAQWIWVGPDALRLLKEGRARITAPGVMP